MEKNINISQEKLDKLLKLWFVYGNNGIKSTLFNHKYIQGFIEANEDRKEPYLSGIKELKRKGMSKEALTEECINEVEKIVYNKT